MCFLENIAKYFGTFILKDICQQVLLNLQYDCPKCFSMVYPQGSQTYYGSILLSYDLNLFECVFSS